MTIPCNPVANIARQGNYAYPCSSAYLEKIERVHSRSPVENWTSELFAFWPTAPNVGSPELRIQGPLAGQVGRFDPKDSADGPEMTAKRTIDVHVLPGGQISGMAYSNRLGW